MVHQQSLIVLQSKSIIEHQHSMKKSLPRERLISNIVGPRNHLREEVLHSVFLFI